MNSQTVLSHPHSLLEAEERLNAVRWFALYTKSRHEKLVSRELEKKGIESFLPLRKVTRDWSDRKKIIEEPLFKGYLFVHMPIKERWTVLNTVGAVRFIGKSAAEPIEVPEKELLTVRQFIESEIQVDPFPYLKEGQRVYVRSGPFKGTEGFVVRKDRHCRLVISLDVMMKSMSVVIDEACIEPL
jgi:transcription termination/antitermination protein NusG